MSGAFGRAAVPSGASTGQFEAVELRDGDASVWLGKGVSWAVAERRRGDRARARRRSTRSTSAAIDSALVALDGTPNKGRLGANAILGCLAGRREGCGSARRRLALPLDRGHERARPACAHAERRSTAARTRRTQLDLQEFMIVPAGADSFSEALRIAAEVFHTLKSVLHERGLATTVGDEGGFAPDLPSTEAAIETVLDAAERAGHRDRIALALDPAMTELWKGATYEFEGRSVATSELVDWWTQLARSYPIVSIEDALAEDEWDAWAQLTGALGDSVQLVGDDLFVTNVERLRRGIEGGVANAVLVKVNQIGTLTETLDTIALARSSGYATVISHRSGETEDTTIADLAVATNAGQIKTGAPSRSDRVAKYNQLLRIEEELGDQAVYPGWSAFPRATRG